MPGSENLNWYTVEYTTFDFPFTSGKENRNNIGQPFHYKQMEKSTTLNPAKLCCLANSGSPVALLSIHICTQKTTHLSTAMMWFPSKNPLGFLNKTET